MPLVEKYAGKRAGGLLAGYQVAEVPITGGYSYPITGKCCVGKRFH